MDPPMSWTPSKFAHAEKMRNPPRINPTPRIWQDGKLVEPNDPEEMSPADHWRRISELLDAYNERTGRK